MATDVGVSVVGGCSTSCAEGAPGSDDEPTLTVDRSMLHRLTLDDDGMVTATDAIDLP